MRTALVGQEAAAVPTGSCDPEAALPAGSASLPGSLFFLSSLSCPPLAPCSPDPAGGAEGLKPLCPSHGHLQPGAYLYGCLGDAGKCVSKVRFGRDKWAERGREGASAVATGGLPAHPPGSGVRKRGSVWWRGSGPRGFTRVCPIASDLDNARRSNLAGVSRSAPFFLSLLPALCKQRSETRLPPAAFFTQLDTLFRLMVF